MILLRSRHLKLKPTLDDIFAEEDSLGLLDVEPLKQRSAAVDLMGSQFADILAFYDKHGRAPQNSPDTDFEERKLARRLQAIQSDPEQCKAMESHDIHGLLVNRCDTVIQALEPATAQKNEITTVPKSAELVTSLDDIFADDTLGLLDFSRSDIFNISHVPVEKSAQPDEYAQRQPCLDFARFAPMFDMVKTGMTNGKVTLERYRNHHGFKVGDFFILSGVMGYVNSAGERLDQYDRYNARLHLVFENGTELYMLYQSLTQGLIRDREGRKVMLGDLQLQPNEKPVPSGFIYVLATQSTDPALFDYKQDLYKIGFTEGTVEDRIKNAENDKTFLQAPVRIITTFKCFNMNTQKLETLVHGFLTKQRLNITLMGQDGTQYTPREWFNAPLSTVITVINHIMEGTISQYRMDNTTSKIVAKKLS